MKPKFNITDWYVVQAASDNDYTAAVALFLEWDDALAFAASKARERHILIKYFQVVRYGNVCEVFSVEGK